MAARDIVSDGVRLHVDVDGDGPPVLLAHGFAGSARNWWPQARALRERFTVVRYDARGHARSAAPTAPGAYTPDAATADVSNVLDAIGAGRAVVGGLSMGAAVALRFALMYPERVRGLVLAAHPAGREQPGGYSAMAIELAGAIEREGIERAGERFVWGPESELDPEAARLVRQGFREHTPHGLALTLRGILARLESLDEYAHRVKGLAVPALVIVGAEDRHSIPPSRRLADLLPKARLVIVPGAGHVVNLAAPEAFNAALEEMLAGLGPEA